MVINIYAVLHGDKIFVNTSEPRIIANPPMSEQGMIEVHDVLEDIRALLPFDYVISSRVARANDTASAICMALDLDWKTNRLIGQHASLQDGMSVKYPGYEYESYPEWVGNVREFLTQLGMKYEYMWEMYHNDNAEALDEVVNAPSSKTLLFTHRPIVASMVRLAEAHMGTIGPEKVKEYARGQEITEQRLYHFQYAPASNELIRVK